MVLLGSWKAMYPGQGRQPSYFINALSSLLTSWDKIWEERLKADGAEAAGRVQLEPALVLVEGLDALGDSQGLAQLCGGSGGELRGLVGQACDRVSHV